MVDNFEDDVIRKPDIVKKQRLMDTQYDYFDFQAKKNAMAKNMPVRSVYLNTFRFVLPCFVLFSHTYSRQKQFHSKALVISVTVPF